MTSQPTAGPQAEWPAPAPDVNPETKPFWDATAEGRLLLKRCQDCGSVIWYPRAICPECSSMNTEWFQASGRGTVYSYTVNHRPEGVYKTEGTDKGAPPLVLAYVQLEEGPRVMTNVTGAGDDLAIGLPVEVTWADTGAGSALPRFRALLPNKATDQAGLPNKATDQAGLANKATDQAGLANKAANQAGQAG